MNTGDERDIRELLRGALDTVTPAPAPLSTVLGKGKAMRRRRRIGAAAGLAAGLAVVVTGITLAPGLLHQHSGQPPVTRHIRPQVTVHAPGPGSPRGEIAWGTVKGRRWRMITTRSGALSVGGVTTGPRFVPFSVIPPDPITLGGTAAGAVQWEFGAVRPDVTSVVVTLADGETLRLHPVNVFGHRLVGYGTPLHAVARITAYKGPRELAYVIPFNGAGGPTWGVSMLRPGQPVPPRISGTIFAGRALGSYYRITANFGPWGLCIAGHGATGCSAARFSAGGLGDFFGVGSTLAIRVLAPSVKTMVLTMSGGRSVSVPLVKIGGLKFFTLIETRHRRIVSWATFGAAGNRISGGTGAQLCPGGGCYPQSGR